MIYVSARQMQIIEAFFQLAQEVADFNDITMQMIADRAGIARPNIYAKHFKTKKEITDTIHNIVNDECAAKLDAFVDSEGKNIVVFFADEILPLLYDKRDWLKILYGTSVDSSWIDFLLKSYTPILEKYFTKTQNKNNIGLPDKFLCNLIIRQTFAIIASWLTSDSPAAPYTFAQTFIYIFKNPTYNLLVGQK